MVLLEPFSAVYAIKGVSNGDSVPVHLVGFLLDGSGVFCMRAMRGMPHPLWVANIAAWLYGIAQLVLLV